VTVPSTFDYQRILARLIVDESFFDDFVADRDRVMDRFGLDDADRSRLGRLDENELAVFKDVVNSTREINFGLVFSELHDRMSAERWTALLSDFRRAVVLRDSSSGADLDAFCEWLDEEYPGSRVAALARYQLALQAIGSTPVTAGPAGTAQVAPRTQVFTTAFDFDALLADGGNIWTIGAGGSISYFGLQGTLQTDDVSIMEVPYQAACLLAYLGRPRALKAVRDATGGDDALVSELLDLGLIVEN
jgi:hypothetical protein